MNNFQFKTIIFSLALCGIGYAQTSSEAQTRDLWFLQKQGQFLATGGLATAYTKTDIEFAGAPDFSSTLYGVEAGLNYGITDQFRLGAGVGFSGEEAETKTGTTTKKESSSGLEDPIVGLSYRALEQASSGANLEFALFYSPSLGKSKDNNQLRGSHEFSFSVGVGQQLNDVEYSFSLSGIYNTEEKDESSTDKARFGFGLAADFQYDFTEVVALDFGIDLGFPGALEDKTSGVKTKFDYTFGFDVGPSFQITETLAAGIKVGYVMVAGDVNGIDLKGQNLNANGKLSFLF